ncbi:MAG: hypothetical protein AB7H70_00070 [Rhodospirillaceae bacterium]
MSLARLVAIFCLALITDAAAQTQKQGALRLACDGPSEDAIVTINGEEKGPCPMNILVAPGPIRVHAQKENGDISVQVFDQAFTLQPGEPRRVDIELSAPKLTEKGQALKDAEDEAKRIAAAKEAERVRLAAVREQHKALVRRFIDDAKTVDFAALRAAEDADPEGEEVYPAHMIFAAMNANIPEVMDVMERGAASGAITAVLISRLPKLPMMLEQPTFVDLVTRLVGEEGLATVRAGATPEGRLAWFNEMIGSRPHNYLLADDCDSAGNCSTFVRRKIVSAETQRYTNYPPGCSTVFHMGDVIGANDATPNGTEIALFWGGLASAKIAPMTAIRSNGVVKFNPTRDWPARVLATPGDYHAIWEADLLQTITAACTQAVADMTTPAKKKR